MLIPELIFKKRSGLELTRAEIEALVLGFSSGEIPDYQMSAFLMAVYFKGMTDKETYFLTDTMMRSGRFLDFSDLEFPTVDKHSTGGVGDKTSLILGPIVACYNVGIPMIAGRGLGHTGGTTDKLESIPGLSCNLSIEKFKELVRTNHFALIAQTPEICPADKKMYALRDVTATVESIPLICGSIMSKKLAEGAQSLVLDVKFGNGAFMESTEKAENLALNLQKIGRAAGRKVTAFLTSMNQPLGQWIGNACEVQECIDILKGSKDYLDTLDLSLNLSAEMLLLTNIAKDFKEGLVLSQKALDSGRAYEKFEKTIHLQGGNLNKLPRATQYLDILSGARGYIEEIKTKDVGYAGIELKAGRAQTHDSINPVSGIRVHKKVGDFVEANEPIYTIFSNDTQNFENAKTRLENSYTIGSNKNVTPLIYKVLK